MQKSFAKVIAFVLIWTNLTTCLLRSPLVEYYNLRQQVLGRCIGFFIILIGRNSLHQKVCDCRLSYLLLATCCYLYLNPLRAWLDSNVTIYNLIRLFHSLNRLCVEKQRPSMPIAMPNAKTLSFLLSCFTLVFTWLPDNCGL